MPNINSESEIAQAKYDVLELKYTSERESWNNTEKLLRSIIQKKLEANRHWQRQAEAATNLCEASLESEENWKLRYLALLRRHRELETRNSNLRFALASYEGEILYDHESEDEEDQEN